ncbi:MAG: acetate/propionate family kinase [Oscillospiraceae bacterium]|nr:acetate/propionate family kinase [Oscillospiraceae bacterium]
MKILVLNAGSSSMKFKLYDMSGESVIAEGNFQKIGLPGSEISDHSDALREMLALIGGIDGIGAVGHRISMGGDKYRQSAVATEEVIRAVEGFSAVAPLHTPPQAGCVRACKALFGEDFPMAISFDTAFHYSIPEKAYLYGIPYEYYEKYGVRRFGFHGLSYRFVVDRYNELTGGMADSENLAVCHLGGGASVAAVKHGICIDNSFGFGTGEGLPCGSRAGTLDHVAIGYLMDQTGMTYREMQDVLHKKSGILGISGLSSDEKMLEEAAANGHGRAQLALDVMAHSIKKIIGAYTFAMGGLDTIIFTGGIENSNVMRTLVCDGLDNLGITLDADANVRHNRAEHLISSKDSRVKIWIIPTNEELVIARDTYKLVQDR